MLALTMLRSVRKVSCQLDSKHVFATKAKAKKRKELMQLRCQELIGYGLHDLIALFFSKCVNVHLVLN